MRLHHVQVAMPAGGEDDARRFYADGLGLTEVDKPEDLRARGGCWFRDPIDGAEIHLGVEDPFTPARKAHPALLVADGPDGPDGPDGIAALEAVGERLTGLGFDVDWSQRHSFPGHQRLHAFDAAGNRVEVLARA